MSIQIVGTDSAGVLSVDETMKAASVSTRPSMTPHIGWTSLGVKSGVISLIAAAGPVFAFRNIGENFILIRRIGIGVIQTNAFGTPQKLDFSLNVARHWFGSDSGGTATSVVSNFGKHRTGLETPNGLDIRISSGTALGAGTRVVDANALSIVGAWAGGVGELIPRVSDNLFGHSLGDYPLVFRQNEGFLVLNATLMGAGGGAVIDLSMEFAELETY